MNSGGYFQTTEGVKKMEDRAGSMAQVLAKHKVLHCRPQYHQKKKEDQNQHSSQQSNLF
jgi:hypothetical protein